MAAKKAGSRSTRKHDTRGRTKAKTLEVNPFVALVREVKPDVDRRLDALLQSELARHADTGHEVTHTLEAARALCSRGGKRLRAALVVAGLKAFEKSRPASWETALECGVAVELLQAYFLIHDDWMDQDDVRRGGPAVHAALSRNFKSKHTGAAAAILAGDYLVGLATLELTRAAKRHAKLPSLLEVFAEMQLAAVVGQQLDVIGQTRNAERIYELKTASYTVTGPLQLGALLAGASRSTLTQLAAFSKPLGVAFQLRDDLIGAFGSTQVTGKPRGGDILQGKWTYIVQHALEHGTPAQRRAISAAFGKSKVAKKTLEGALSALGDTGSREACEKRIDQLRATSVRNLKKMTLTARGRELLTGAVSALSDRQN